MRKFNMDDYEPVEARIVKFKNDHPEGRIITALVSDPNNMDFAVFKADIYNGDNTLLATGHAQEIRDKELSKSRSGGEYESVNYTSWLENAETSAIGRALANAGYQGSKKRPSREEMEKVERMTGGNGDKHWYDKCVVAVDHMRKADLIDDDRRDTEMQYLEELEKTEDPAASLKSRFTQLVNEGKRLKEELQASLTKTADGGL